MPDNRESTLLDELWGEESINMQVHYPKKVTREWQTVNRLTNVMMGKGDKQMYPVRTKGAQKGMHHRWDVNPTEDTAQLQDWSTAGDLVMTNFSSTQRLEMGYYDWQFSVEVDELRKERMGGINQLREFTKEELARAKAHIHKDLNQKLATGSGEAQDKGEAGYHIFGYQTLLTTSIAGSYAQVARSGNTWLQHQIVNGDAGPNTDWEDDPEERIEKALDVATVDIDGREYSPNIGLTSRAALHDIRQNMHTRERIISEQRSQDMHLGALDIFVRGVPIFYDNTISDAAKKLYLLDTKSWLIKHGFKNLVDFYIKELSMRQGKNVAHVFRGRILLACERHRPNAVIYWA